MEISKKTPIETIYTYADNRALGFFQKAGFTKLNPTETCKIKKQINTYYDARLMKFEMKNFMHGDPEVQPRAFKLMYADSTTKSSKLGFEDEDILSLQDEKPVNISSFTTESSSNFNVLKDLCLSKDPHCASNLINGISIPKVSVVGLSRASDSADRSSKLAKGSSLVQSKAKATRFSSKKYPKTSLHSKHIRKATQASTAISKSPKWSKKSLARKKLANLSKQPLRRSPRHQN